VRLRPGRESTLAPGNRVPPDWPSATDRGEPLNLRWKRPPTLSTWGSDTCILYSPGGPYGRTCHRYTCHPGVRPWDVTQELKHKRGIELSLFFLTPGVRCVEGFLRALRLRQRVPISLSCCYPVFMRPLAFLVPQFGKRLPGRSV